LATNTLNVRVSGTIGMVQLSGSRNTDSSAGQYLPKILANAVNLSINLSQTQIQRKKILGKNKTNRQLGI